MINENTNTLYDPIGSYLADTKMNDRNLNKLLIAIQLLKCMNTLRMYLYCLVSISVTLFDIVSVRKLVIE